MAKTEPEGYIPGQKQVQIHPYPMLSSYIHSGSTEFVPGSPHDAADTGPAQPHHRPEVQWELQLTDALLSDTAGAGHSPGALQRVGRPGGRMRGRGQEEAEPR